MQIENGIVWMTEEERQVYELQRLKESLQLNIDLLKTLNEAIKLITVLLENKK